MTRPSSTHRCLHTACTGILGVLAGWRQGGPLEATAVKAAPEQGSQEKELRVPSKEQALRTPRVKPLCPRGPQSPCTEEWPCRMVTPQHTARGRPSHKPRRASSPGAAVQRGRLQGAAWGEDSHTHRFRICLGNSFGVSQASGPGVASCSAQLSPCPGRAGPHTDGSQAGWRRG